jgi:hypothetical protein
VLVQVRLSDAITAALVLCFIDDGELPPAAIVSKPRKSE